MKYEFCSVSRSSNNTRIHTGDHRLKCFLFLLYSHFCCYFFLFCLAFPYRSSYTESSIQLPISIYFSLWTKSYGLFLCVCIGMECYDTRAQWRWNVHFLTFQIRWSRSPIRDFFFYFESHGMYWESRLSCSAYYIAANMRCHVMYLIAWITSSSCFLILLTIESRSLSLYPSFTFALPRKNWE